MKKLLLLAIVAGSIGLVRANTYTVTAPSTLNSLEHQDAYTWGLAISAFHKNTASLANDLAHGLVITKAEIEIWNVWDWKYHEANALFIDLIDNPKYSGVHSVVDNPADNTISDYFTHTAPGTLWSAVTPLTSWSDSVGGQKRNFNEIFDLTLAERQILATYLTDPKSMYGSVPSVDVGLAFDPDCHFYDCKITFTIVTCRPPVPEGSATILLLGMALLAIPGLKRLLRA